MDEIDNHPLSLLLLLNQEYFTQFLEWAQTVGWVEPILFLLEVDCLRFKSDDKFRIFKEKVNMNQALYFLTKAVDGPVSHPELKIQFNLSDKHLHAMRRLVDSRIPLYAGFSHMCDSIWQAMLRQGRLLVTNHNSIWPSLRRLLVEHVQMSLDDVLADPSKRKYFEKFLQVDPCDLMCLQCYISVQRIFEELSQYATLPSGQAAPTVGKGSYYNEKEDNIKEKKSSSIMRRWRTSGKATLLNPSSLAFSSKATSSKTNANASIDSSSHTNKSMREFVDFYASFKLLLKGSRGLQKQFFPVSSKNNNSLNSNNNALALNINARVRRSSSMASVTSIGSNSNANASSSAYASSIVCAGMSEPLRMEIAATITLNSAVRIEDIEIIDPSYAVASCHMLDGHLQMLERELYQHLTSKFALFEQSNEYIYLVAHSQALSCPSIHSYYHKLQFLSEFLSGELKQELVHWADPRARGVLFLKYAQPAGETEEEEEGTAAAGDDHRDSAEENGEIAFAVPNIIAGRFDLCIPEDTAVTRDHAQYMPHQLRLWSSSSRHLLAPSSPQPAAAAQSMDADSDVSSVYSDASDFLAPLQVSSSMDYDCLFKVSSKPNSPASSATTPAMTLSKPAIIVDEAPSEDELLLHEHAVSELEHSVRNDVSNIYSKGSSKGFLSTRAHSSPANMFSMLGLLMDLLSAVGVQIEAQDFSVKDDQTFMTVLQINELSPSSSNDVYRDVLQIHRQLFPDVNPNTPFKLIISLKTTPFAGAMKLSDAIQRMQHIGTGNSRNVTNNKASMLMRYVSAMQLTFSICSCSKPAPGSVANSEHAGYINLLREINYALRDLTSSKDDKNAAPDDIASTSTSMLIRDCYHSVWTKALEIYQQPGEQLHPVLQPAECIYDLYLGSHLSGLHSSARSPYSPCSPSPQLLPLVRSYSLTKLFGIYDSSLCATLSAIPLRLLLQMLMLMLSKRPSLAFISSNTTLLMKLKALLPRLLHPFSVDKMYRSCCIHSSKQLSEVYRLKRRAPVQTPSLGSFMSPPLSRGSSHGTGLSMLAHSSADTATASFSRPPSLLIPLQMGSLSHDDLMSPSADADGSSAQTVCRLCFIDARSYQLARIELLNGQVEVQDAGLLEQTIAFDLDAAQLVDSFLVPIQADPSAEHGQDGASSSGLDLKDPRLFQSANFDALRCLQASIKHTIAQYVASVKALQPQAADGEDGQGYNLALASATLRTNCQLEAAFHLFWTQLVLKAIPAHLQQFAEYHTISCDMQSVIAQLLSTNGSSIGYNHHTSQAASCYPPSSSGHSSWLAEGAEPSMEFEDFLSFFNEHTASAGKSLCHVFYADFLAGLSPVFLDLLKKHGQLLDARRF